LLGEREDVFQPRRDFPFLHGKSRIPGLLGLFAGIGGFEIGFEATGHVPRAVAEIDRQASEVLSVRIPNVPNLGDVREIRAAPRDVEVICAGFPCQDLSTQGDKQGLYGDRSVLAFEIIRLIRTRRIPVVVLENVEGMLQRGAKGMPGMGMHQLMSRFEALGYNWAYRLVDAMAFGVPQRRKRLIFVLSNDTALDPRDVLLVDNVPPWLPPGVPEKLLHQRRPRWAQYWRPGRALGFYVGMGAAGAGWALDAVPPIMVGSGIGIPSPPSILMPSGEIIQPHIRDLERLQGFAAGWTEPAAWVGRRSGRWRLLGNAVPPTITEWVGGRIRRPGRYNDAGDRIFTRYVGKSWPLAAYGFADGRRWQPRAVSQFPVAIPNPPVQYFLEYPGQPVSLKAITGFLRRARRGTLALPPELDAALSRYAATAR
jgi:DNA (cytosine-5)-methyltransferase 1